MKPIIGLQKLTDHRQWWLMFVMLKYRPLSLVCQNSNILSSNYCSHADHNLCNSWWQVAPWGLGQLILTAKNPISGFVCKVHFYGNKQALKKKMKMLLDDKVLFGIHTQLLHQYRYVIYPFVSTLWTLLFLIHNISFKGSFNFPQISILLWNVLFAI